MNPDAAKHLMSGPAFPHNYDPDKINEHGMSLRDYFAAKAMQGLLASPGFDSDCLPKAVATDAYATADAMLAERVK